MERTTAIRLYLAGLFTLLCSNAVSACCGALGVHGIAFYHIQAVLLILCGASIATLLVRGRISVAADKRLLTLVALSMGYTVLSAILLLRFEDTSVGFVALMLYTFLVYPGMAIVMLACSRSGPDTAVNVFPRWMIWASVAVLVFGWLQFAMQNTVLHVTNSENVSKLVEASLLGTFRPPSVFVSSLLYGLFSVFILCQCAGFVLCRRAKLGTYALALVAFASALLSQTRNIYLCGGCALVTVFLFRAGFRNRTRLSWFRKLPAAYVALSISTMLWAVWQFLSSDLQKTEDLADASSAWARVSGWQTAWTTLVSPGSWFDFLFGYGITQPGQASDYASLYPARGEGLFIDSTFLNLFLFQGIIGLAFYIAIYWMIWRSLLSRIEQRPEPFTVGLACFVSAFLAVGVLNIVNGQWWGIIIALSFVALPKPNTRSALCAA